MAELSEQLFRRTKGSLTWHFREDCRAFPKIYGYIVKRLQRPLGFQMICVICKRLAKEEKKSKTG